MDEIEARKNKFLNYFKGKPMLVGILLLAFGIIEILKNENNFN